MSDTVHIARHNDYNTSNFELRGKPIPLHASIQRSVEAPGIDRWEDDGGPPAREVTVDLFVANSTRVKPGLSRKQKAARAHVKWASITLVPVVVQRTVQQTLAILDKKEEN